MVGLALVIVTIFVLDPAFLSTRRIDPVAAIAAQGAFELPAIVALLIAIPRAAGLSLAELGFTRPTGRTLVIAAAGVALSIVAVSLSTPIVSALTHSTKHPQEVELMFVGMHEPWKIFAFAFFAAVVAPIAEEVFFRLFLFNIGLRYGGFWIGAIVSSALFGLAHGDLANALPLACVGAVLCGVYYYSRNAYASMIAHGAFNLVTVVALLYLPKLASG